MKIETAENIELEIARLDKKYYTNLVSFLGSLSDASSKKFGPHGYDFHSIEQFYLDIKNNAYIITNKSNELIAYAILRIGYLEHDRFRLESYGLELSKDFDSTFAPAVSDQWQGKGLGKKMFEFLLLRTNELNIKRIILWGGVQSDNEKALIFYKKVGFVKLGAFEYNGLNYDMIYNCQTTEQL